MNSKGKKIRLGTEFLLLFFGIPLLLLFTARITHPSTIILPILVAIVIYLGRLPAFGFKDLIRFSVTGRMLLIQGIIMLITSSLLVAAVFLFDRDNLFNLPRANPRIWILICVVYPIFSAYGQEVIYRVFLFYRYRPLFRTEGLLIIASAVGFSFVHIIYYSHIAIVLTFLMGLYLAWLYSKTRSVLFIALLHGFLGDVVFTIGMGSYFWVDIHKFIVIAQPPS